MKFNSSKNLIKYVKKVLVILLVIYSCALTTQNSYVRADNVKVSDYISTFDVNGEDRIFEDGTKIKNYAETLINEFEGENGLSEEFRKTDTYKKTVAYMIDVYIRTASDKIWPYFPFSNEFNRLFMIAQYTAARIYRI